MKRFRFAGLFLMALLMVMAVAGTVSAASRGSQDFTLVNGTNLTIREIYLSPSSKDQWIFQDELGKNVLRPGQDIYIDFDPMDDVQYWDIMVVYENGDQDYWYSLDLFRIYWITIRPGGVASLHLV